MRILFAFWRRSLCGRRGFAGLAADQQPPTASRRRPGRDPRRGRHRSTSCSPSLKRERNEKAAERIAGQIWNEWFKSGSATIDLMMQWAQNAMDKQKYDVALDFLDQVIDACSPPMPRAGTGARPCIS